jgi:hypothetical protein
MLQNAFDKIKNEGPKPREIVLSVKEYEQYRQTGKLPLRYG